MRALITGGGGQLASDLALVLGADARSYTRDRLDIGDVEAVERAIDEVRPDVVFNCAAFHNLDLCEADPASAWKVNVEAVRRLAQRASRLVHVSTNYVFDGERDEPYAETDLPSPRSVYAITKLAGEHAALAYGERSLVVRTAGLYGLQGSVSKGGNFVQRMIARAREQGSVRMVADQYLQPTFTADLASAIVEAVRGGIDGVVHLTASGSCSWYEFTAAIMERAGIDVPVEPASTVVPPGGVQRPLNGVLARRVADIHQIPELRRWDVALTDYMERAGLLVNMAHSL
jgi:dTDP-4-dehydrorhamnose reductase